jgi:hypothetical protein
MAQARHLDCGRTSDKRAQPLLRIARSCGYRSVPPTGTFWDVTTKGMLALNRRPKGSPESRFAKVFRTDWNGGTAFYHPYDRVAAQGHPDWAKTQPHLIWTDRHMIVDYLQEIHSLLTWGDYSGV